MRLSYEQITAEAARQEAERTAAATPRPIPASKAELDGTLVSTKNKAGGIGIGRLVAGRLYVSGGNGWYYPSTTLHTNDDGAAYAAALHRIDLPPAYHA